MLNNTVFSILFSHFIFASTALATHDSSINQIAKIIVVESGKYQQPLKQALQSAIHDASFLNNINEQNLLLKNVFPGKKNRDYIDQFTTKISKKSLPQPILKIDDSGNSIFLSLENSSIKIEPTNFVTGEFLVNNKKIILNQFRSAEEFILTIKNIVEPSMAKTTSPISDLFINKAFAKTNILYNMVVGPLAVFSVAFIVNYTVRGSIFIGKIAKDFSIRNYENSKFFLSKEKCSFIQSNAIKKLQEVSDRSVSCAELESRPTMAYDAYANGEFMTKGDRSDYKSHCVVKLTDEVNKLCPNLSSAINFALEPCNKAVQAYKRCHNGATRINPNSMGTVVPHENEKNSLPETPTDF